MRPQKVGDQVLLNKLLIVLRAKGYDGATLNDLAESSGLQKASLYHRFPGGKEEIASCVLNYLQDWIKQNIYRLLVDENISIGDRLKRVIKNINTVYNNGDSICLLRALTMDSGIALFSKQIKESMLLWVDGFTKLGVDCGMSKDVAKEKAHQVLVSVQGSLVVSRGLGSTTSFKMALKSIEAIYRRR